MQMSKWSDIGAAVVLAAATAVNLLWLGTGPAAAPAAPAEAEVPVPADTVQRAVLLFAGDLMQHTPQTNAARRADGTFDYTESFAAVAPLFRAADLAVVNLETTLTRRPPYRGYPCFRSPAALGEQLRRMEIDAVLLANNHCCDGGSAGIATTVQVLDSLGIRHTGAFADTLDFKRNNTLYIERCGIRFALLNYTYGTNGIPVPRGCIVNLIDTLRIGADLAAARDSADCVVACMHWGNEYQRQPDAGQRRLAEFLRRHGADLIIGSHPHVIQPFEADSTGVTLYSLGNFVSNQRKRYCDGGLLARITVEKRPGERCRYRLATIPVWVQLPGYRILPAQAADTMAMPSADRILYETFREDTRRLLAPPAE